MPSPYPALALCAWLASAVSAQTAAPPSFEAASLKPNRSASDGSSWNSRNGSLTMQHVTLKTCIQVAYGLREQQVAGPAWLASESFDIVARAGRPAGDPELMQILHTLLAERFKFCVHRETRPAGGFALLAAKGGVKLKESAPGEGSRSRGSRGQLEAQGLTMADLARELERILREPVVDLSGVPGRFDLKLVEN